MNWLSPLVQCPVCGSPGLTEGASAWTCANGHSVSVSGHNLLFADADALSEEWKAQQAASVERYADDTYNEQEEPILRLFGGFIAIDADRDDVVLDLGCGLTKSQPAYVDELGLTRYVGLEPIAADVVRDYPCFVGAIAEHIPMADDTVDIALFSTSLDHIEAEDEAIAETLRVLKPDGRIVFWQGLHEPRFVAASKTFEPIFAGASGFKRWARILAGPVEYASVWNRMRVRARKLATGERIDDAHCRYYTLDRLDESLARWGLRKERSVVVPGTASVFVSASRLVAR